MGVITDVVWPPREPLTTERLTLRQTQASDRPGYVELLCSDDVRRFLGGASPREAVERLTPEVPGAYPGVFAVNLLGSFIGAVMIERRDREKPGHVHATREELEVSYALLTAYRGRGLASEAVAAVLAWTWRHFPSEPVLLCTQTANRRSLALARRLEFVEAATFPEHGAEQWLGVRWPQPQPLTAPDSPPTIRRSATTKNSSAGTIDSAV
jgi:RimJ/RimL family protein N-acetyltransferase